MFEHCVNLLSASSFVVRVGAPSALTHRLLLSRLLFFLRNKTSPSMRKINLYFFSLKAESTYVLFFFCTVQKVVFRCEQSHHRNNTAQPAKEQEPGGQLLYRGVRPSPSALVSDGADCRPAVTPPSSAQGQR